MEESLNKKTYKILLICLKYLPWLILIMYFINILLNLFGVTIMLIPIISQVTLLPGILIILFSILFKFCIWHRLPIYYCWINNLVGYYDYIFGIPLPERLFIWFFLLIGLVLTLLGMYFKNRYNERKRIIKNNSN